ncbi:MAG: hypothetical protein ABGX07_13415 [Pirellulaceae bacterium]
MPAFIGILRSGFRKKSHSGRISGEIHYKPKSQADVEDAAEVSESPSKNTAKRSLGCGIREIDNSMH